MNLARPSARACARPTCFCPAAAAAAAAAAPRGALLLMRPKGRFDQIARPRTVRGGWTPLCAGTSRIPSLNHLPLSLCAVPTSAPPPAPTAQAEWSRPRAHPQCRIPWRPRPQPEANERARPPTTRPRQGPLQGRCRCPARQRARAVPRAKGEFRGPARAWKGAGAQQAPATSALALPRAIHSVLPQSTPRRPHRAPLDRAVFPQNAPDCNSPRLVSRLNTPPPAALAAGASRCHGPPWCRGICKPSTHP
jgi:hypothetical protein